MLKNKEEEEEGQKRKRKEVGFWGPTSQDANSGVGSFGSETCVLSRGTCIMKQKEASSLGLQVTVTFSLSVGG